MRDWWPQDERWAQTLMVGPIAVAIFLPSGTVLAVQVVRLVCGIVGVYGILRWRQIRKDAHRRA